jgi:hypothetical protein
VCQVGHLPDLYEDARSEKYTTKKYIEVAGGLGRRCKQLLNNLKKKIAYCKLQQEALDRTVWRTGFGTGYGFVVRQTARSLRTIFMSWFFVQQALIKLTSPINVINYTQGAHFIYSFNRK